jgi:DNA-binding transcriptional LysR family regulator
VDKLRAIEFFCRVVEANSFAAAAHDLDTAPSVLSRAIVALEADLRTKLFNRTTRRLSVTDAGARYYEECKKIVGQLEEAEAAVRSGVTQPIGLIRAGMHPAIGSVFVDRAAEFFDQNPGLRVERTLTNKPSTLLENGLDVLFAVGELADSTLTVRKIGSSEIYICASPAYLEKHGRPDRPQDLERHRTIIPGRRDEVSFADWSFARGSVSHVVIAPAAFIDRDGSNLARAGVAGAGIIRIFEVSARVFLEQGTLIRLLPEWDCGSIPIHAVTPGRKNVPAKSRAIIEFVRTIIKPSAERPTK